MRKKSLLGIFRIIAVAVMSVSLMIPTLPLQAASGGEQGISQNEPVSKGKAIGQYDSIPGLSGEILYDTSGNQVKACGGEIHQYTENGVTKWYWFGEDVGGDAPGSTTGGSAVARGIHLYSSTDLYNWTCEEDMFKGMTSKEQFETDEYFKALYGSLNDSEKDIVFDCLRNCPTAHPKVIYNERNHQYVMWVPGANGKQCIAVSDSIKGPFKFVKYSESILGFGTMMYQDASGAAYTVYQNGNDLYMARLTDDYMDITESTVHTLSFDGDLKLSSAEGGMFQKDGKYYIVSTHTKQYAVANSLNGAWTVHPLQLSNEEGQVSELWEGDANWNPTSCVLKVNTEEGTTYVNICEKWDNTAVSQTYYMWLPIKFSEDGTVTLSELSNWKLENIKPEEPKPPIDPEINDSIDGLSGEILYDTDGERVYACGGEVHQVEEDGKPKWYWFGVDDLEDNGQQLHPGIHLYSSTDLYNWKHEGTMGIEKGSIAHPKVLYNEQQKQYVMWFPWYINGTTNFTSGLGVATSKSIKGPFEIVSENNNKDIMNFINLYKDRDGTAYIIYGARDNHISANNISIARLSADYTQIEGEPKVFQFTDGGTLYNSEGGIFERNGKYYIINAGNPEEDGPQYAQADSLDGPWTVHKLEMWNQEEQKFEEIVNKNQTSNVFQVKTGAKETFVCIGDSVGGENPNEVRYIWLPIKFFEDGKVALEKLSNWKLDLGMEGDIEVTEVRLTETSKTLKVGEKYQINATVVPTNATNQTLSYRSADETVATVTPNGEVEAKKAGSTTVTVMSVNGKKAELQLTVEAAPGPGEGETPVEVTEVRLPETSKTLKVGEKYQINASVLPTNATNQTLSYRSADETVATVTPNGEVEAKKAGNTTVTVTSANGKKAELQLTVEAASGPGEGETPIEVTEVRLSETSKTLKVGEKYQINASVLPTNATNQTLSYRSADETVATVTPNGEVEAKKAGNTTVTVTSANGKKAELQLTVEAASGPGEGETPIEVTEVKLTETSKTLKVGEKYQINASVLPTNATNQTLSYRSADETVAMVSPSGLVEAKKAGKTTVTVTSANGKKAELQLTVEAASGPGEGETPIEVTEVKLTETSKTLKVGEKYQINASVLPTTATNQTLSYRSGDETVATVSPSGLVEAKKAGKTTVTVTSANGKKAELQLTVEALAKKNEVQKVLVSAKKMTVGVGEKVQLEAGVYPKNASNKKLTYKSSNNKVKVNKKGLITAQKVGSCKITISSSNNKKAVVKVTVKKKPGKISLNAKKKTLKAGKKFQIKPKLPKGTASYKITYSSNKKSVATVSANGKVTAKKKGNAVITAKTYNGKKAVVKITVK